MSIRRTCVVLGDFAKQQLPRVLNRTSYSSTMAALNEIIKKNEQSEQLLTSLQAELNRMQNELLSQKKQQLRKENVALTQSINENMKKLIALEIRNGKKQIPVPGIRNLCTDSKDTAVPIKVVKAEAQLPTEQIVKEKKAKKEKVAVTSTEAPIDVGRLDLRVGKIVEVSRHPDADTLYLEKIDVGEPQPRTVVSGLVKFIPLEEMQNRMVVVLCNLKPAKMRGVTSEAMVMCASSPNKIEVLSPPVGAVPGDLIECEGYVRQPDAQLNPKKKIFETCAPDLMTNSELVACYKAAALYVAGKGNVVAQTLKNVQVK